jgi:hypothetical protein
VLPLVAEDIFTEPATPVLDKLSVVPVVTTFQPAFWNTDDISVTSEVG